MLKTQRNHFLRPELKRILFSKRFFFMSLLTILTLWSQALVEMAGYSTWTVVYAQYYFEIFFFQTTNIVLFLGMILIATVIPEDLNLGFVRYITTRISKKSYIFQKALAVMLSLFIFFFLSALLYQGSLILILSLLVKDFKLIDDININPTMLKNLAIHSMLAYCLVKALFFSLFHTFWCTIGAIISAYFQNIYLSIAGPMILIYSIGGLLNDALYFFFNLPFYGIRIDHSSIDGLDSSPYLSDTFLGIFHAMSGHLVTLPILFFILVYAIRSKIHEI